MATNNDFSIDVVMLSAMVGIITLLGGIILFLYHKYLRLQLLQSQITHRLPVGGPRKCSTNQAQKTTVFPPKTRLSTLPSPSQSTSLSPSPSSPIPSTPLWMQNAALYTMVPIATIRSPFQKRVLTPRQSMISNTARFDIVFEPSLQPQLTLRGLEEYNHVWVIFLFDQNTNLHYQEEKLRYYRHKLGNGEVDQLLSLKPNQAQGTIQPQVGGIAAQVPVQSPLLAATTPTMTTTEDGAESTPTPTTPSRQAKHRGSNLNRIGQFINALVHPPRASKKYGVYGTRSPHRHNAIGLSLVKIVEVHHGKGIVTVVGGDFLNGTPVLDIKPFHPCEVMDPNNIRAPEWVTNDRHYPVIWKNNTSETILEWVHQNKVRHYNSKRTPSDGDDFLQIFTDILQTQDPRSQWHKNRFEIYYVELENVKIGLQFVPQEQQPDEHEVHIVNAALLPK